MAVNGRRPGNEGLQSTCYATDNCKRWGEKGWGTRLDNSYTLLLANKVCTLELIFPCRIIIGAPNGTFPGGLPLTDPGQMAESQTGLVYSCPVLPGDCEGIQGNISIYSSCPDNDKSDRTLTSVDIEGRLFDQARKNTMSDGT